MSEKIYFTSDYVCGAQPELLAAIEANNARQMPGYGEDDLCAEASAIIRGICGFASGSASTSVTDAPHVHFVPGGTQANLLVCAAALRPHQGAVAAESGHISVHETGAIEATGHKVLTLPATQGKLSAEAVQGYVRAHKNDPVHEHTVQPGMVYISQPTEYGTLYTRRELEALHAVCREEGLYLYADGARLGYGLCAAGADFDIPLLAECCDAFTIGGTKLGTLFGEAIVITNPALNRDFRYIEKQRGAMMAKGWLLGLQFKTMLENWPNCLYLKGANHAITLAGKLTAALTEKGIPMLMPGQTNQLFPILSNEDIAQLGERFAFETWETVDEGHTAIRFCTAWSTTEAQLDELAAAVRGL